MYLGLVLLISKSPNHSDSSSGYGTETFTYSIETTNNYYDVTVDVEFYIKAPDTSAVDSDWDYLGFTEVLNLNITKIERYSEDGESTVVLISELSQVELIEIRDKLYNCIEDQALGETLSDDC